MLGFVGRFPVVTRNSTASHCDTGSFSWPESPGLTLPRNQHGPGPISEPRTQCLDAAGQHGHVEARVAHDAVADPRAHAVGAHGLRAENLPVGTHVHEDMHGLSAGEIARVLVRVRVHREVLRARGVEGLAVSACARDEAVAGVVIVVPCAQAQ